MKELKPDAAAELAVAEAQVWEARAAIALAEAKLRVEILALEKAQAEEAPTVMLGGLSRKPQTLEERVAALEKKLAEMEAKMTKGPKTGTNYYGPSKQ
jgi:hypothetical protein